MPKSIESSKETQKGRESGFAGDTCIQIDWGRATPSHTALSCIIPAGQNATQEAPLDAQLAFEFEGSAVDAVPGYEIDDTVKAGIVSALVIRRRRRSGGSRNHKTAPITVGGPYSTIATNDSGAGLTFWSEKGMVAEGIPKAQIDKFNDKVLALT